MKEILTKANEFVSQKELEYGKMLFEDLKQAERHAQTCGCPNCKKEAISASEAFTNEAQRLYPEEPPIDHEEQYVRRHGLR